MYQWTRRGCYVCMDGSVMLCTTQEQDLGANPALQERSISSFSPSVKELMPPHPPPPGDRTHARTHARTYACQTCVAAAGRGKKEECGVAWCGLRKAFFFWREEGREGDFVLWRAVNYSGLCMDWSEREGSTSSLVWCSCVRKEPNTELTLCSAERRGGFRLVWLGR